MKQNEPLSVLVAPLDWGLGHATRCIPIIKELISQGARVVIAASGSQKTLLIQEFPSLEFLEIPGYKIRYKTGVLLKWALAAKIPSLLRQIKRENKWLEQTLKQQRLDAVISDNRYGLYHKTLYTVFITHQLYIQSGWNPPKRGNRWRQFAGSWVDRMLLKWNYKIIEKFSCIWVPDMHDSHSIAGRLSHPPVLPSIPLKFIGILSRFDLLEKKPVRNSLLILLSGPEPQRSRFENILFRELKNVSLQTLVVRGLPGSDDAMPFVNERVKIFNHLPAESLKEKILEAEFIIARSGYSTIMDLVKLNKNAILVPTPGQTEQEYLGSYLHEKGLMYMVPQKNFCLQKSLTAFQNLNLIVPAFGESSLKLVVEELLNRIGRTE